MAGLVPALHDLLHWAKDVDARRKAGHDENCRNIELGLYSTAAYTRFRTRVRVC